ncbi:MAG TPA: hypothetical protein VFY04_02675 [Solirubrobacterales bacterium]|nr:hypothetical protein [Solirubrobacterales bacterium]
MTEPEIRASDLAYVSRWGRAVGLLSQLARRPDPVKMLEERQRRGEELRQDLTWPERDASPEVIVIRLRDYLKYPNPDDRVIDFWSSSWFKFEVKAITDDSLEIFASIQEVRVKRGKARPVKRGENGFNVFVVGRIPLESIALIQWEGDPAYGLPRLYCHYGRRGPFREVAVYEGEMPRLSELDGVRFKGRGYWFPRRFWMNWRMRREQKKFEREQRKPLEEWEPSNSSDDDL